MPDAPVVVPPHAPLAKPPGGPPAPAPAGAAAPPAELTAPTTPETPAPVVEPEKAPKEGKLLSDIRAREKALVDRQQAFARERKNHEDKLTRERQEFDKYKQERELARTDPLAYFRQIHGITAEALAGRLLNQGRATPVESQTRLERDVADLRQALETERTARAKEKEEAETVRQRQHEEEGFVKQARAGSDKWPLSSKYSEKKLISNAWTIVEEFRKQGIRLDNEVILDKIEEELAEIASLKGDKSPAPSATPKNGQKDTPAGAAKPAPTLTSQRAGERASGGPRKVNVLAMSDNERKAHTMQVLAELRAKQAASKANGT